MKKIVLIAALLAIATTAVVRAENIEETTQPKTEKQAIRNGSLGGRVVDENMEPLPGAVVYIAGLGKGTHADEMGYFFIPAIAPGTHKVEIRYIGYEPYFTTIDIQPGSSIDAIFNINEGLTLDAVQVTGIVSGRRKALQQQRSAIGISNVISADQMERFPDENIGDALKRIPGVNVQYDQGEARFGQVRGTAPDMNAVTVNGNRTPSAEGGTRAAQLDLIPAEMIQTIDVRKVVTSDMDGDAIGGSINLVTKSAPTKALLNSSLSVGYNPISEKATFNGSLSMGKRFFKNKLGVMIAASYHNNPIGSDNIEAVWSQDDKGDAYVSEFQARQYFVQRERQSYTLSADYNFNANNRIEFKAMYNRRNDWENRYRLTYKDITAPDQNGISTAVIRRQTKGGVGANKDARLELQQTQSYNLSGEHRLGRWTLDWNADYAIASEDRPNERYIGYESNKKAPFSFHTDLSNGNSPMFTPVDPSQMELNEQNFPKLQELTESFQSIQERELKATINAKVDILSGDFANSLMFGYKLQNKLKDNNIIFYDIDPINSDFNAESMQNTVNMTRSNFLAGNYSVGQFISKGYLASLNFDNQGQFKRTRNLIEEAGNYSGHEIINAGYLRFNQQFGSNLELVAGVRVENTSLNYKGNNFDINEDEDIIITPTESRRTINNILPSAVLKYTPVENLILRAAYTSTIARPKFRQLVPGDMANLADNALTQGNPNLKNTLSDNFDLMAEYYLQGAGIISAGVYYKNIKDFIVDAHLTNQTVNGREWKDFYRAVNAGNAYVLGVEAAIQTDLGFISPVLKNFGIYLNYTFNLSQITSLTDPIFAGRDVTGLGLPGTPKHVVNASIYYENKFLSAAVSYNFADSFLDNEEMGATAFTDRYYDKVNYLDVNVSVKATKWLTVFAEVNNLLNQPLRYYQGVSGRVMQAEYYGIKGQLGVKIKF